MDSNNLNLRGIAVSGLVPPHSEVMSLFRRLFDGEATLRRIRLLPKSNYRDLALMDWPLLKATAKRELATALREEDGSSYENVIFASSLGTMLALLALDDLFADSSAEDTAQQKIREHIRCVVCYGCPYHQTPAFRSISGSSCFVSGVFGRTPILGGLIKRIPVWKKWHQVHQRRYWIPLGAVGVIFQAHAEFRKMVIRYASDESAFPVPVAFLHGTEDRLSHWSGSRRVAKLLRQHFEPIELAGNDPSLCGDPLARRALLKKAHRFVYGKKLS
ncbi:MAG: hypothetical protein U0136_13595 [Bdellovibrionota bacterium]